MILDAKFKPIWGEYIFNKGSFPENDYNKCIRDMNAILARATGAIFPTNLIEAKDITNYSHSISEKNPIDKFYAYPIYVPESESKEYEDWLKEFNDYCVKASNIIKQNIKEEYSIYNKLANLQLQINEIRNTSN